MEKPTLFGYGKTTKAIASSLGGSCIFFDDKTEKTFNDNENNIIYPSSKFDPQKSNLEVFTPSFPPNHPLLKKALNSISEYDYFKDMPFSIWISGTNGKTTTTQMLQHLLEEKKAVSGGNIGTPLAFLDLKAPIWILETSSFTLHHTNIASPNIYILLPITPDHLDWHGDFKSYQEAKLKPLLTMKEGELALIPKGLNIPKTDAFIVEYENSEDIASYFNIEIDKLNFKGVFLQDALLSLAITKTLFDTLDYELINNFKRDEHRQEEIIDKEGRLWVNDSKATNLDATIQAIETYKDKELLLILGGEDKGANLSLLFEKLKNLKATIYPIGKNTNRLLELAKNYNIKAVKSKELKIAIEEIKKVHNKRTIAILSPASASIDQFSSYIARGKQFKELI